jgi:hypothetical protein
MPTFNRSKKKNKSSIKRSKQKGGNCKVNDNIIDSLQTLLFIPFHKYIKYPMPCLKEEYDIYSYNTIFDVVNTESRKQTTRGGAGWRDKLTERQKKLLEKRRKAWDARRRAAKKAALTPPLTKSVHNAVEFNIQESIKKTPYESMFLYWIQKIEDRCRRSSLNSYPSWDMTLDETTKFGEPSIGKVISEYMQGYDIRNKIVICWFLDEILDKMFEEVAKQFEQNKLAYIAPSIFEGYVQALFLRLVSRSSGWVGEKFAAPGQNLKPLYKLWNWANQPMLIPETKEEEPPIHSRMFGIINDIKKNLYSYSDSGWYTNYTFEQIIPVYKKNYDVIQGFTLNKILLVSNMLSILEINLLDTDGKLNTDTLFIINKILETPAFRDFENFTNSSLHKTNWELFNRALEALDEPYHSYIVTQVITQKEKLNNFVDSYRIIQHKQNDRIQLSEDADQKKEAYRALLNNFTSIFSFIPIGELDRDMSPVVEEIPIEFLTPYFYSVLDSDLNKIILYNVKGNGIFNPFKIIVINKLSPDLMMISLAYDEQINHAFLEKGRPSGMLYFTAKDKINNMVLDSGSPSNADPDHMEGIVMQHNYTFIPGEYDICLVGVTGFIKQIYINEKSWDDSMTAYMYSLGGATRDWPRGKYDTVIKTLSTFDEVHKTLVQQFFMESVNKINLQDLINDLQNKNLWDIFKNQITTYYVKFERVPSEDKYMKYYIILIGIWSLIHIFYPEIYTEIQKKLPYLQYNGWSTALDPNMLFLQSPFDPAELMWNLWNNGKKIAVPENNFTPYDISIGEKDFFYYDEKNTNDVKKKFNDILTQLETKNKQIDSEKINDKLLIDTYENYSKQYMEIYTKILKILKTKYEQLLKYWNTISLVYALTNSAKENSFNTFMVQDIINDYEPFLDLFIWAAKQHNNIHMSALMAYGVYPDGEDIHGHSILNWDMYVDHKKFSDILDENTPKINTFIATINPILSKMDPPFQISTIYDLNHFYTFYKAKKFKNKFEQKHIQMCEDFFKNVIKQAGNHLLILLLKTSNETDLKLIETNISGMFRDYADWQPESPKHKPDFLIDYKPYNPKTFKVPPPLPAKANAEEAAAEAKAEEEARSSASWSSWFSREAAADEVAEQPIAQGEEAAEAARASAEEAARVAAVEEAARVAAAEEAARVAAAEEAKKNLQEQQKMLNYIQKKATEEDLKSNEWTQNPEGRKGKGYKLELIKSSSVNWARGVSGGPPRKGPPKDKNKKWWHVPLLEEYDDKFNNYNAQKLEEYIIDNPLAYDRLKPKLQTKLQSDKSEKEVKKELNRIYRQAKIQIIPFLTDIFLDWPEDMKVSCLKSWNFGEESLPGIVQRQQIFCDQEKFLEQLVEVWDFKTHSFMNDLQIIQIISNGRTGFTALAGLGLGPVEYARDIKYPWYGTATPPEYLSDDRITKLSTVDTYNTVGSNINKHIQSKGVVSKYISKNIKSYYDGGKYKKNEEGEWLTEDQLISMKENYKCVFFDTDMCVLATTKYKNLSNINVLKKSELKWWKDMKDYILDSEDPTNTTKSRRLRKKAWEAYKESEERNEKKAVEAVRVAEVMKKKEAENEKDEIEEKIRQTEIESEERSRNREAKLNYLSERMEKKNEIINSIKPFLENKDLKTQQVNRSITNRSPPMPTWIYNCDELFEEWKETLSITSMPAFDDGERDSTLEEWNELLQKWVKENPEAFEDWTKTHEQHTDLTKNIKDIFIEKCDAEKSSKLTQLKNNWTENYELEKEKKKIEKEIEEAFLLEINKRIKQRWPNSELGPQWVPTVKQLKTLIDNVFKTYTSSLPENVKEEDIKKKVIEVMLNPLYKERDAEAAEAAEVRAAGVDDAAAVALGARRLAAVKAATKAAAAPAAQAALPKLSKDDVGSGYRKIKTVRVVPEPKGWLDWALGKGGSRTKKTQNNKNNKNNKNKSKRKSKKKNKKATKK